MSDPAFTSTDAFKRITFDFKKQFTPKTPVNQIRESIAKSEGSESSKSYMDTLDSRSVPKNATNGSELDISPEDREMAVEIQKKLSESIYADSPLCFIFWARRENGEEALDVLAVVQDKKGKSVLISTGESVSYTDESFEEIECQTGERVRKLNAFIGITKIEDVLEMGFSRYVFKDTLGLTPKYRCLKPEDDLFRDPKVLDVLFGTYGTAGYIRELVMHLWNSAYKCHLPRLLGNADKYHHDLTLKIIDYYGSYGEQSKSFMEVTEQIRREFDMKAWDE